MFASSASSQSFEGGHGNCGKKSHDPDHGKEFDEGERRYGAEREKGVKGFRDAGRNVAGGRRREVGRILDFGFWIGRGDWLTQRSQRTERGDLICKCEIRNSEFENREECKAAVHSGLSGGGSKKGHD